MMAITGKKIKPVDLLPDWITGKKTPSKEENLKELRALKKRLKIKD